MKKAFQVKQFSAGSCYSYCLSSGAEALLIDAHISLLDAYVDYLKKNGLTLKGIVDTHTHADHFSLAAVLKKKYAAPVLMHERAVSHVADARLKEGDQITVGSSSLRVLYTPGHTDDAVSLYGEARVFTGDVLLIGSVGRTDFQNGSPESMFETLQRIKELPDETIVLPAHDYHEKRSSTIAREKEANPYLREVNREAFASTMRAKTLPKPFNIDNIIRVNQWGEAAALETVSPRDALSLLKSNPKVTLLDVRSALEFSGEHIEGSINVPIDGISARTEELGRSGKSYIVLCSAGNRSPMAADMLIQSGIPGVKVMAGGVTRWRKDGLGVIQGQGGVSLERQVRVIAGGLMLSGIILSLFLHPWFLALSALVACGLLFAGLTDTCLMGMLLMKLPYNKNLSKTKLGGGTCSISE